MRFRILKRGWSRGQPEVHEALVAMGRARDFIMNEKEVFGGL